ncbi:22148_t:CDS:1 [Gigaspora margarita]|uniref:22148_t:CDS:1 n=1 Tax=Gigaspora margarita TaxID=4874 RepID=A0ABN7URT7_GIGMA|nr:22148_t:CDS:1 [Gigaspora margarita]
MSVAIVIQLSTRGTVSRRSKPRSHSLLRVNNTTLTEFCFSMVGRAYIEGSKSNVTMNAWLPQASYPRGNFSGTSSLKFRGSKGTIGHTFMVCIHTENQNQGSFTLVLLEISVLNEPPALSFNRCAAPAKLPPNNVFNSDQSNG